MSLRYGSVCSGIEAATVAWHPLGWQPQWFAEIEPFPCAVLKHHYPQVPNLGDITASDFTARCAPIDVLVGGTPCQAFSIAGLRGGMSDPRGQLTRRFVELADALNPSVVLWENVPGVLSSDDNAFGCFLAGLAGEDVPLIPPGDKWTNAGGVLGPKRTVVWRVLDAQYFGVAQRRRRVFVVASPRTSGVDPRAILFEREGVRRDSPPSREAGEEVTGDAAFGIDRDCIDRTGEGKGGTGKRSGLGIRKELSPTLRARGPNAVFGGNNTSGPINVAPCLNANKGCHSPGDFEAGALCVTGNVTHALRAEGADASEDGTGRGTPIIALKTHRATSKDDAEIWREGAAVAPTLTNRQRDYDDGQTQIVAFSCKDYGADAGAISPTLRSMNHRESHANGGGQVGIAYSRSVRRLTPTECERLQAFPDNYTKIPWKKDEETPDGHRYKALGNSMCVNVMRWIGIRIGREVHRAALEGILG